ncbi:MAG TPA: DUF4124 domain-containing protein [Steroidobacteraceae bacterium]|nr:DUF4124 domain-containing protein [Steroidobacteraceae bacterium]
MRRIVFTLLSLAASVALATTVYKWVDDNGVVHYSDQPHPNAQKLQVEGVQTYSSRGASVPAPAGSSSETRAESDRTYQGCAIAQPLNQQSLPNAQSVFIRVATDPVPRPGDRIYIMLDGQGLNGGEATGMSFNVTPIERGAHTVAAQVRDGSGQILCQTPAVTFYVQQPNLFSPGASGGAPAVPGPPPRPH